MTTQRRMTTTQTDAWARVSPKLLEIFFLFAELALAMLTLLVIIATRWGGATYKQVMG